MRTFNNSCLSEQPEIWTFKQKNTSSATPMIVFIITDEKQRLPAIMRMGKLFNTSYTAS